MLGSGAFAGVTRSGNFYEGNELEEQQAQFFEDATIRNQRTGNSDVFHTDEDLTSPFSQLGGGDAREAKGMPLFKKYRIKMTNYFRTKAYNEAQEALKREQKWQQEDADKEEVIKQKELEDNNFDYLDEDLLERNINKVYKDKSGNEIKTSKFEKFKNVFKRNKSKVTETDTKDSDNAKVDSAEPSENQLELSGGVKEVVAEKDVILDCDKMDYSNDTGDLVATGHPVLSFPPQGVTIKADKLIYNTASNIIKAYDNVEIIRNGSSIYGDYIQINMNDETSIVKNMKTDKMNMIINAKNVTASEDTIVLEDGNMTGDKHYILYLRSRMIGPRLEDMLIDENDRSTITGDDGLKVKIKADEIYVTAKKDHDIVTVKNADIYLHDNHLTRFRSFTAHTNKNHEYFEANYPELGSKPRLGMFVGPGFVFDSPYGGGTFKVIPFLNYKSGLGAGAALKYRSGTNFTEAYYGSAADIFMLKGRQFLDDRLYLQYGVNSYVEDWFLGSGMSKYQIEAVYRDSTTIPNTIAKGLPARYRQRITAGYIQDSTYNRRNENITSGGIGTTRFKYMAELAQSLYNYENKEKLLRANLSLAMQGSAALYGTGDTQFIGRIGPLLHTQYKYWMQDLGYFLAAYDDKTPIPRFDTYRYGKSNVYVRESLRLNKYLTVSWMSSANLSDDAPNNKVFQENGFYFSLGPDDVKVTLGYDFIREQTIFLFTTSLDMKGTSVDYKKMVIKNPEKLSKDDSEKVELVNFDQKTPPKVKRTHAEVIEIQDPDREQIQ